VNFSLESATPGEVQFALGLLGLAFQLKNQLDRMEQKIDAAALQEHLDMAQLDDQLVSLTATVAQNTTVMGSAAATITGISAQIAAAVAAAQAAGATPAELQALTDLQQTLDTNNATLAAAIAFNTPVATEVPPGTAMQLRQKISG